MNRNRSCKLALYTPVGGLGFLLSPEAIRVCLLKSSPPSLGVRDGSASVFPRRASSLRRGGKEKGDGGFLMQHGNGNKM